MNGRPWGLCFALVGLWTAGCVGSDAGGDAAADDFLVGGKTDTGGVVDGTPEAWGVLALVNEASLSDLVDDVGLARRSAEAIDAYKRGDDELAGTADDAAIGSLAELDAIPYVGPVAFRALLTYARDNGYLDEPHPPVDDPFAPDACDGPAMTMDEALARRASDPVLGTYEFAIRRRGCDTFGDGSCGEWQPVQNEDLPWAMYSSGVAQIGRHTNGFAAVDLNAGTCGQWEPGAHWAEYMIGARCTGVGQTINCPAYGFPCNPRTTYSFDPYREGLAGRLSGKMTNNCLQLRAEVKNILDDGPSHEAAILVRY